MVKRMSDMGGRGPQPVIDWELWVPKECTHCKLGGESRYRLIAQGGEICPRCKIGTPKQIGKPYYLDDTGPSMIKWEISGAVFALCLLVLSVLIGWFLGGKIE